MLYLSAQPDTTYFIWQLEIQLRNLHNLEIQKDNVIVLIAYDPDLGLNPDFKKFIDENDHLAQFYLYPDLREEPKYISSIRPNILKQHFSKYSELSLTTIMYHDSDILFSRIPIIGHVEENDICYVSDTRNYLDINYIRATSNEDLLDEMLGIVGLSKEKLIIENEQTGGAQYILKGVTAEFWEKVEQDSENLYLAMKNFNRKIWEKEYSENKDYRSKKSGIQAWCADMWAVLWNLWLENKPVLIHPEMAFSWPYSPISDWNRLAIQHYSGNIEDGMKFFKKNEYLNYTPWYDDKLETLPTDSCSYEIVKLIKERRKEFDLNRITVTKKAIILKEDNVNKNSEQVFFLYKKYIAKYLDIEIFYMNMSEHSNGSIYTDPTSMNNVESLSSYNFYLIIPLDLLIDVEEIKELLEQKEVQQIEITQNIFVADALFSEAFSKILDVRVLTENKGKFNEVKCLKSIELMDHETLLTKNFQGNFINMNGGKAIDNCFILS